MASKFNFGKRLRVTGHEYRKTDYGAALRWGCSYENRFLSKRWHPSFNSHLYLIISHHHTSSSSYSSYLISPLSASSISSVTDLQAPQRRAETRRYLHLSTSLDRWPRLSFVSYPRDRLSQLGAALIARGRWAGPSHTSAAPAPYAVRPAAVEITHLRPDPGTVSAPEYRHRGQRWGSRGDITGRRAKTEPLDGDGGSGRPVAWGSPLQDHWEVLVT